MGNCNFCSTNQEPLEKVYDWDKPDRYAWYCQKHVGQVRAFHRQQELGFLEHFKDAKLRELYLNDNQKKLYERVAKKYQ